MKATSSLRLLIAILLIACTTASRTAEPSFRVIVFNIHAGRDASGNDNLERVAALIASTNADLALLQEVDRNTTRSGNVDQVAVLARLTRFHAVFGKSLDYQGGEYGIATLSRWPVIRQMIVPLPVQPPQARAGGAIEPRVALVVDVRTPAGVLRVLNTHLDPSREEGYRLQEIDQVIGAIEQTHGVALVAGGDFNAVPDSGVHERLLRSGLRDAFVDCGGGDRGLTYPAAAPVKRIDYLFLTAHTRCTSAEVLESTASDHRPVLVNGSFSPRD